jgi:hypothetical protein
VLLWAWMATADAGEVTRTYAMRQTFTSQMRNPNPFSNEEWSSTRTNAWAVVRWTQDGLAVQYVEDTCSVRTDKVFGAETTYPSAFVNGIDVRRRSATLSSDQPGAKFMAGPYAQQFGVKLSDPFKEALPTADTDPRLIDDDGDGNPGMTVTISHPLVGTGHVWVAQRSVARLEGAVGADGSINGVIYTAPDMFKIGADRWWLKSDSPQRPHPDPKASPFVMVPVPDGTTCEEVMRRKDELFPAIVAPR